MELFFNHSMLKLFDCSMLSLYLSLMLFDNLKNSNITQGGQKQTDNSENRCNKEIQDYIPKANTERKKHNKPY